MADVILNVENVKRTYAQAGTPLDVLKGASFSVSSGEMVALVGPSGSGKSTLLQCIGLLDTPTSGTIHVAGQAAHGLSEAARTRLRRDTIGFVYQAHHLLPEFSALENIILPQMIAGVTKTVAIKRAQLWLDNLGLSARASHRPARLSGGEQQRVAMARALVNQPKLLLADEPTGNLDPETSEIVFKLLSTLVKKTGVAAIIATHNLDLAARMDRTLRIQGGLVF